MKSVIISILFFCTVSFAESKEGEKLFLTNCSSCHGSDGKSQTDIGKAVKARNLVVDEFKQVKDKKKGVTENDIFETLKTGVPGTGMASFAHLPEKDRRALAKYVYSLHSIGQKTHPAVATPKK